MEYVFVFYCFLLDDGNICYTHHYLVAKIYTMNVIDV